MIIHDVEQGTDEWHQCRAGLPTGSEFKKIITSQGKKSATFNSYVDEKAAETYIGRINTDGNHTNFWMERGTEMEEEARSWFTFQTDLAVDQVGFVTLDNGTAGVSPDGLVGDLSGFEVKCPAPKTHVKYLMANKVPSDYFQQVQGCMWVCERTSWHFVSYHPEMPRMVIEVERDDSFIATLSGLVKEFHERKMEIVEKMRGMRA